ncbi:MAG: cytochrome c biogenesis protein CcdA [Desulfotomaculum sp.]|nr:cytochrome c biogenesis protein CcdA [Desulfotomaculum sp.]
METFFLETLPAAIAGELIIAIAIVFLAGVLTSISPCILAMMPMMVGYIGGYGSNSRIKGFALSTAFVVGLATTFASFGLLAALAGQAFKFTGDGWYYLLAAITLLMGLQLLGVINIRMPTGLKKMPVQFGGYFGAYVMGLFFGLVASPCATPVLAVIITYVVATQGEVTAGSFLLFVYGLGHGLPLIILGTFTALVKNLPRMQRLSGYVNYVSGGILVLLALYLLILATW